MESGNPDIPGVKFCGMLKAVTKGGTSSIDAKGIHISGADEATLLFSAGTDMVDKSYADHVRQHVENAARQPYADLKKQHIRDHQRFFRRAYA